jgi:hypothetical protein
LFAYLNLGAVRKKESSSLAQVEQAGTFLVENLEIKLRTMQNGKEVVS